VSSLNAASIDIVPALKAAACDTAAAVIVYYDNLEFAANVCKKIAIEHESNDDSISFGLQEAANTLQNIVASKPLSLPSKFTLASALADAELQLRVDPGFQAAQSDIKDALLRDEEELLAALSCKMQQLLSDEHLAEKDCEMIAKKLQGDEDVARSSTADDMLLIEYQLGVDAAQIRQLKDEEARALASLNSKSA
jgi:hypothetical protein